MASKGPKSGAVKPAVSKASARAKAVPTPKLAADVAEAMPAPFVPSAPVVEASEPVPVPFVAAPQAALEVMADMPVQVADAATETVEAQVEAVQSAAPAIQAASEPVIETVTEAVETIVPAAVKESTIMDTFQNTAQNAAENTSVKAQAFFADFNDRAKAAAEKSTKLIEEANDFAKGNVEALVESGKIAAKGLESFGQDAAEYSRRSFETATAVLKSMSAVKSPTEFFKLQSDFFRSSFDSYVAEASKNTEAMIKLASDAAQPLSNRVALAAEKAKIAA